MSDVKDIEVGEDAVTNTSTDSEVLEVEEPEKGLIRVVCYHHHSHHNFRQLSNTQLI
jgi:hypothetical protein